MQDNDGQITNEITSTKSQIICKKYLNQNLKSKIKSQIIKSNTNHFRSKSNHKSILPKFQIFDNIQFT